MFWSFSSSLWEPLIKQLLTFIRKKCLFCFPLYVNLRYQYEVVKVQNHSCAWQVFWSEFGCRSTFPGCWKKVLKKYSYHWYLVILLVCVKKRLTTLHFGDLATTEGAAAAAAAAAGSWQWVTILLSTTLLFPHLCTHKCFNVTDLDDIWAIFWGQSDKRNH